VTRANSGALQTSDILGSGGFVFMDQSPFTSENQADSASAPTGPLIPCDKTKILIVDDEVRIREVFRLILSDGLPDCKIDVAANGKEALEILRVEHPAVVVMDLHMSVMDGQAAFMQFQKQCKDNNWEMPSIIFCTGFAHPETVRSIVVRNATHCLLSKPVRGETLLNVVKSRIGVLHSTNPPAMGIHPS
jgi:CheY-like chemotaxis protein